MKFKISRCYYECGERVLSNYPQIKNFKYYIDNDDLFVTISSIAEMMKFRNEIGNSIIIDDDNELIIYDDYIE